MSITQNTIVRGKFETAREMAFGSITSSFTQIGDVFEDPFSIVYVQNFTDVVIDFSISYEGLTTTFSLAPSTGTFAADMIANGLQISSGEAAWCKYRTGAASSGFVQVVAIKAV